MKEYMNDCFPSQRLYLNNRITVPHISEIIGNWPYLFHKKIIGDHFKELMNIDIGELHKNFNIYKIKLISFFRNSQNRTISSISVSASDEEILKYICRYFQDDPDFLFKTYEVNL